MNKTAWKRILQIFLGLMLSLEMVKAEFKLPGPLENLVEYLFLRLPSNIQSGDIIAVTYFKFLLWIAVYAGLFYGCKKIFKDDQRIASVVAILLSLTSVIFIPNNFLIGLFKTYKIVVPIIIIIAPTAIAFYYNRKHLSGGGKFRKALRVGIYVVAAIITIIFASLLTGGVAAGKAEEVFNELSRNMGIGAAVCLLFGLGSLIHDDFRNGVHSTIGSIRNRFRRDDEDIEEEEAKPETKWIEQQIDKFLKELLKALEWLEKYQEEVMKIKDKFKAIFELKGGEFAREYAKEFPKLKPRMNFDIEKSKQLIAYCKELIKKINEWLKYAQGRGDMTSKLIKLETDLNEASEKFNKIEEYFK